MQIMSGIMNRYRDSQPAAIGGLAVASVRDFKTGKTWKSGGKASNLGMPESDVLQWLLSDGTLVTVRPSGTEPKIKFYILSRTPVVSRNLAEARKASAIKIAAIEADLRKALQP